MKCVHHLFHPLGDVPEKVIFESMSICKIQFLFKTSIFSQQKIVFFLIVANLFFLSGCKSKKSSQEWVIRVEGNQALIKAGILEQHIELSDRCVATDSVLVDGVIIAGENADEFSVVFWKASPNTEPQGMDYSPEPGVDQQDAVKNQTDALTVEKSVKQQVDIVGWIDSVSVSGRHLNNVLQLVGYSASSPEKGTTQPEPVSCSADGSHWEGLSAKSFYEIYDGFPAIRKWVRFKNFGLNWIKIDIWCRIIWKPEKLFFGNLINSGQPGNRSVHRCIQRFGSVARGDPGKRNSLEAARHFQKRSCRLSSGLF
jgi:hypothetical protein